MIHKIISGGQTGVDRAALDFAIANGVGHGGYCPRGRRAEDGIIPERYKLQTTKSEQYIKRTHKNIDESDGTLILYKGKIIGGTLATMAYSKRTNTPLFEINLLDYARMTRESFTDWIIDNKIASINIAGPRQSETKIYREAITCLEYLLTPLFCDE